MIKHIVLLKFKESAHGNTKAVNMRLFKEKIEALRTVIPGIHRLEVGIDFSQTEQSSDVALFSEFESRAALDAYQAHPAHQAVLPFISEARTERRLVDYED